jgi:hypothetical protein
MKTESQVSLFMIPGPNLSIKYLFGKSVPGGWLYGLENLKALSAINGKPIAKIIIGHLEDWGPLPEIPRGLDFEVQVENITALRLKDVNAVPPSMQHGMLLNYLVSDSKLDTPFFGVIDPDCYLISEGSLADLLADMQRNKISVFGVPYPPNRFNYLDYPTPIFSVFDSRLIDASQLDFRPPGQVEHLVEKPPSPSTNGRSLAIRKAFFDFIRIPLLLMTLLSRRMTPFFFAYEQIRFSISSIPLSVTEHDTGWKVREFLLDRKLNFEILNPVFPNSKISIGLNEEEYLNANPDVQASGFNPSWHFLVFGLFQNRKIGKQNRFWTKIRQMIRVQNLERLMSLDATFTDAADPIVTLQDFRFWKNSIFCDQYNWNGVPFAVHLSSYGKNSDGGDAARIRRLLEPSPK